MKIIFCADLSSLSASGFQRLWAMRQYGCEVTVINKQDYCTKFGKYSSILAKLLQRPELLLNSETLSNQIIDYCGTNDYKIIWLEWVREFLPKHLLNIKQAAPKSILISFQDDNPWGLRQSDHWLWKNYYKNVPYFDIHLVKRDSDITQLKGLGAKECRMWMHGVYPPVFHPPIVPVKKKYLVSFVGTCMDNRVELIKYLLEKNIPIHVFGNRWDKRSNLKALYPNNFHKAVEGRAYADVIRESQICLGLVSDSNNDEWTMRSFEVPACGGLLLAQRTPKHESFFEENTEAIFFSSFEECAIKIKRLLSDPEKCQLIGENGHKKCIANFLLESQMKALLDNITYDPHYTA